MWNPPTEKQLDEVPELYCEKFAETPLEERIVHMHFFLGGCDWYVIEYNSEDEIFFGHDESVNFLKKERLFTCKKCDTKITLSNM